MKKRGFPPKDITGQRFGMLTAISLLPRISGKPPKWLCVCDCGAETHVRGTSLRAGEIKRCKLCGDAVHKTHGLYGTPAYTNTYMKSYYEKNKAKKIAYQRSYTATNRELISIRNKIWKKNNATHVNTIAANRRAAKRNAEGSHTKEEIAILFAKQKGGCAVCKNNLPKSYHRDHIIALKNGGSNWIENIQLLCPSCNTSKQDKDPVVFMQEKGFLI